MTQQHWAILGVLGLVVICVYCLGTVLVVQMLSEQPTAQIVATLESTPAGATIAPPPLANATTIAPLTPTPQSTARPTATWVVAPPQTQTGATSVCTRAPLRAESDAIVSANNFRDCDAPPDDPTRGSDYNRVE